MYYGGKKLPLHIQLKLRHQERLKFRGRHFERKPETDEAFHKIHEITQIPNKQFITIPKVI
jgi:hypothetical protein